MKKIIPIIIFVLCAGVLICSRGFLDMYYFYTGQQKMEQEQYLEAIPYFEKLSDTAISLYNMGNSFFEYGQTLEGEDQTRAYVISLGMYENSLNEREEPDTRANYEYVKSLLDFPEQHENPEESPQEESESESESDQPQPPETPPESSSEPDSQGEESSETQQVIQNPRDEQYQLEDSDTTKELSPEELQELEEHIQNLEYQQSQNQKYFGKQPQQQDIFEQLLQNPFFQNDRGQTEKDW